MADGRVGTPALFDVGGDDVRPWRLALAGVEQRADDVLWLRYRVETDGPTEIDFGGGRTLSLGAGVHEGDL